MEIRDILHGAIELRKEELPIVDSAAFQRLRLIKQLGFSEHAFPSASHNRYMHSLGTLSTASKVFWSIFSKDSGKALPTETLQRWSHAVRVAALLHDIGHGPLSHTTEMAMPRVQKLQIPGKEKEPDRQATHEDYTLKILLDSSLTQHLNRCGEKDGFSAHHLASLIDPSIAIEDDFFQERVDGAVIDFQPLFQQIISSELDADRMDYLRRDSLHAGVSYGQFDADWLISSLRFHIHEQKAHLCLEHRALYAFEDFLISRFHMFLMVYFHHKSVIFDETLSRYLGSKDCDYVLPSDIETYLGYHDAHLYAHLEKSANPWAMQIAQKRPYRMLLELHSGIPFHDESQGKQDRLFLQMEGELKGMNADYLSIQSTSELSKYARKARTPIFVRYDNLLTPTEYIPLEECTDLFQRYEKKRTIRRIYVASDTLKKVRSKPRGLPFGQEVHLS